LTEAAEGEAAVIGAQRRAAPRLPAIRRYVDAGNAASAIPCDTLDHKRPSDANILACNDIGDDRIDDHLGDRLVSVGHLRGEVLDQREAVGRNAIRGLDPEVVEGLADRV